MSSSVVGHMSAEGTTNNHQAVVNSDSCCGPGVFPANTHGEAFKKCRMLQQSPFAAAVISYGCIRLLRQMILVPNMAKQLRVVAKVLICDYKKRVFPLWKLYLTPFTSFLFLRLRSAVTSVAVVHFGVFLYPFVISEVLVHSRAAHSYGELKHICPYWNHWKTG